MSTGTLFKLSSIRFLLKGLGTTIYITLLVVLISLVVGFIFSMIYLYAPKIFQKIIKGYVEIFRNTPMLLWIMVIRFLLPLPLLASGILSMSLVTISGIEEDFRSGISMIPKGQWEAAQSQGLSRWQTLRLVILPQVVKKLLPILLTETVTVLKQSSLLWAIGIQDLTGQGMILVGRMSDVTQIILTYVILALVYYILNDTIIRVAGRLRRKQV